MEDLKYIIARNLTAYRKAMNITQFELAEKLNYSDKAVSKWERAESLPDILVLKQIADLYGITVDDLIKEKDVTKIKVKKLEKDKSLSHLLITILSVGLVWLVAVILFVFFTFFNVTIPYDTIFQSWHCFIIAIPISCIVWVVLSCVWFSWIWRFASISTLVWSIAMTCDILLLSADFEKSYLFYLICVPIQLLVVFWFLLRYVRKKKNNIINEVEESLEENKGE